MTPFPRPASTSQRGFYRSSKSTRSSAEGTFGLYKRRFPIFQGRIRAQPPQVCKYIGVGAILHNVAILLNDPPFDGNNFNDGDHLIPPYNGAQQNTGAIIRQYLADSYF